MWNIFFILLSIHILLHLLRGACFQLNIGLSSLVIRFGCLLMSSSNLLDVAVNSSSEVLLLHSLKVLLFLYDTFVKLYEI